MKNLFFAAFALYAAAVILEFTGTAFKKDKLLKGAWFVFLAAFVLSYRLTGDFQHDIFHNPTPRSGR